MGSKKIKTILDDYSKKRAPIQIPDGLEGRLTEEAARQIRLLFCDVTDYRLSARTKYPIREILLVIFTAVLCGYTDYEEIEAFGKAKLRFFRTFYTFSNGICSHDTFKRALSLVNTYTLQASTVEILEEFIGIIEEALREDGAGHAGQDKQEGYRQICVDGKANTGTGRCHGTEKEKRNLQTLNIYDRSSGICLSSAAIPSKTNEIPGSQKLLGMMDLKNCIVSFDALNTQKKTCRIIKDRKGHYIGGLKENQPGLYRDAEDSFTEEAMKKCEEEEGKNYLKTTEKMHSQIETRHYYRIKAWHEPAGKDDVWAGLKSFIMVRKECENLITSRKTTETRYYISDLTDIGVLADGIRGHWSIENCLHFNLDYTMKQDKDTTTDRKADLHMGMIKKMALSMIRLSKPLLGNKSLRLTGKMIGMDVERVLPAIFMSLTRESILEALSSVK